jgi:hypothetical protein
MKVISPFARQKQKLLERWSEEDYPGGSPRFQLNLLVKDLAIFALIPVLSVVLYKSVENVMSGSSSRPARRKEDTRKLANESHSQIIHFGPSAGTGRNGYAVAKRSPGTIVKVRLLNSVETLSSAPVHAQIIDAALGGALLGGTLIGDASAETANGRIKIDFRFVRDPKRLDIAIPVSARAISLDGTFGVQAEKKEGFFARAALRSAASNPNAVDTSAGKDDFKTLVVRAVAGGLMQEFQSDSSVAHNNAQVYTLKPLTEFYVELTDFFPSQN